MIGAKQVAGPGYAIDAGFDVELADALAQLESHNRHLYRPNSYLHKWWARRCGSTFRLILKALVRQPERRGYYQPGGLGGTVVLDPMLGGGTVLHEAIRLGANVVGADLDPIPVLQARATLSEIDLTALRDAFEGLLKHLRDELAPLFATTCPRCARPTELRFTLYGARRQCGCGSVLMVDSLVLRHQPGGGTVQLCPDCQTVVDSDTARRPEHVCRRPDRAALPVVEKLAICPGCRQPYRDEIRRPFYRRYEPVAIASWCADHGLVFAAPGPRELDCLQQANRRRPTLPAAAFVVRPGPKSDDLIRRGVRSYLDLFSSRQLLYLEHAQAHLAAYDGPVRLYLSLLLSTSLDFNAMLCSYKGGSSHRPGAIRHVFAHHAYSFPTTAVENNPLHPRPGSGTLSRLFHDRVERARSWAQRPVERDLRVPDRRYLSLDELDVGLEVRSPGDLQRGERRFFLIQGSSVRLGLGDESIDLVVTDPPYYDSVQYSDLAAFFHVWLRRMLPDEADWAFDPVDSAVDSQAGRGSHYQQVMGDILAECRRVLKPGGRLVFTFHHWNPRAWAALTLALRQAGFCLINRYTVHAENPSSVHIANLKALTHDVILVLARSDDGAGPVWEHPGNLKHSDSRRFCQDCGSVLGWMLSSDLANETIEDTWFALLA